MKTMILTAALLLPLAAGAQQRHLLVSQWFEGGNTFCKYDNGTILNVGARTCPMSI